MEKKTGRNLQKGKPGRKPPGFDEINDVSPDSTASPRRLHDWKKRVIVTEINNDT